MVGVRIRFLVHGLQHDVTERKQSIVRGHEVSLEVCRSSNDKHDHCL